MRKAILTYERQKGLYQSKVTFSLIFTHRQGHQPHNSKMGYWGVIVESYPVAINWFGGEGRLDTRVKGKAEEKIATERTRSNMTAAVHLHCKQY